LAHAFLWEYSYRGLRLAQRLGQLGVFLAQALAASVDLLASVQRARGERAAAKKDASGRALPPPEVTAEPESREMKGAAVDNITESHDSYGASSPSTSPAAPTTIQGRIDDALAETCTEPREIRAVITEADAEGYRHPSLAALRNKAASLAERARGADAMNGGSPSAVRLPPATAPNAGQDSKGRRESVSATGVTGVVDLARQAAEESGQAGEAVFDVTQEHIRKASKSVQLKIGQMGVHLFDGPVPLASWPYSKIELWEYKPGEGERRGVFRVYISGKETKKKLELDFGCKRAEGQAMCKLMMEHAQQMVRAKTVAKKSAAQQALESLKGAYTVTSKQGIILRRSERLGSELVAVVARRAKVDVVGAQMCEGRTRLHVIASAVKTLEHADDPSGGTEKDVEGWGSIKSGAGAVLVVKAGLALESRSSSSSPTKRIGNTGRRHSVSVGGISNVTSRGESDAEAVENGPKSPRSARANRPTPSLGDISEDGTEEVEPTLPAIPKAKKPAKGTKAEALQEKNDALERALEHKVKVKVEQAEQVTAKSEEAAKTAALAVSIEDVERLSVELATAKAAAATAVLKAEALQQTNDALEISALSHARQVHALEREVKVLVEQAEQAAVTSEAASAQTVESAAAGAQPGAIWQYSADMGDDDLAELSSIAGLRASYNLEQEIAGYREAIESGDASNEEQSELQTIASLRASHSLEQEIEAANAATEAADASAAAGGDEVVAHNAGVEEVKIRPLDAGTETKTVLQQVDELRGKNDELVSQVHGFERTVKALDEQQQDLWLELAAAMSEVSTDQPQVEEHRALLELELEQGHAAELRGHLDRSHSSVVAMEAARASVDAKIVQLHAQMEVAQTASCASRDALETENLAEGMQGMVAKLQNATRELKQATIERDFQAQRALDTAAKLDEAKSSNIVLASKIEELNTKGRLKERDIMQMESETALLQQHREQVMSDLEEATRQVGLLQATVHSQGDEHKELGTNAERSTSRLQDQLEGERQIREQLRNRATVLEAEKKSGLEQGGELKGSRGSHTTPSHPIEDPLDPHQIGKLP
jgi:hypothetical protein